MIHNNPLVRDNSYKDVKEIMNEHKIKKINIGKINSIKSEFILEIQKPDFNCDLLLEALFYNFDNQGVHDFLVNRLFSMDNDIFEFYIA